MWIILIAAVLIVVAALAVVVLRRPRGSDLTSVRKYHSALGTIEHLAERTSPAVGRVVTPPGGPESGTADAARAASGEGPGVRFRRFRSGTAASSPTHRPRSSSTTPSRRIGTAASNPRTSAPIHRADRAQRHALESMNRRPRRATAVMVVVILVALFGVLAVLGSRHPTPGARPPPRRPSRPPRPRRRAPPTTPATARSTATRRPPPRPRRPHPGRGPLLDPALGRLPGRPPTPTW